MAAGAPTVEELAAWCDVELPDAARGPVLEEVLAAVVEWIEDECDIPTTGEPPVATWSRRQHTAGLLLGTRLYKRRQTPEGVAGWGDLGAIRIIADDPDIARLLERSLKLGGFG